MSSKSPRHSPVPSQPASKLPKFLQKQSNRDRAKSITDPSTSASTNSLASGSSSEITPPASKPRKSSKFLIIRDKEDKSSRRSTELPSPPPPPPPPSEPERSTVDEPPVIIEPVSPPPRPRIRTERPSEPAQQHLSSMYSSASSTSRIGDLPTRLSGWFSHTFSSSSTDLSLPALLSHSASSSSSSSPKGKASALLTAAKHGKGHLDKAMRYLLDSDSTPDKCSDPIWIMGVQHPGYESPPPPSSSSLSNATSSARPSSLRSSTSSFSTSLSASTSSYDPGSSTGTPSKQHQHQQQNPAAHWPPVFYADFTSRVWLTYRSHFTPIRDGRLADLSGEGSDSTGAGSPTTAATMRSRPWNWVAGEKGWTSDSGWGCMLRTGQSLLASALVHLHLGRDWRRPPHAVYTADYATYVQILTWFFDTPSPEAPFSVHRMALAGKELGKDVGQWFGPSTAAGAIKTLVNGFTEAGLGVSVATDGVLFQSDVYAASHTGGAGSVRSPKRHNKALAAAWGDRPVLLLIGVRLGLEGVNPIYYDTIKLLYTFPQSVGIAGGRPSSSYYFVGTQADNLFYLDPHHTRPAVPLRPPPLDPQHNRDRETTPDSDPGTGTKASPQRSSTFSYHAPISPSPLQQEFSTSASSSASGSSSAGSHFRTSRSPPPSSAGKHARFRSASASQSYSPTHSASHSHTHAHSPSEPMDPRELGLNSRLSGSSSASRGGLDPVQEHYATAYPTSELKTFHCERVRKMPLSGLDPSMLIGFLCRDEGDWWDFRRRVGELPRMVFSVQDEPPVWPGEGEDDEMVGMESISEPGDLDLGEGEGVGEGEGEEEDDGDEEQFFDTRSASTSSASGSGSGSGGKGGRAKSEEVDTEEDPVDPITPLPNASFSIEAPPPRAGKNGDDEAGGDEDDERERERFEEGDIEDDWIDPSLPTPTPGGAYRSASQPPAPPTPTTAVPLQGSNGETRGSPNGKAKKGRKGRRGEVPVPVPMVKIPTPPSGRQAYQAEQEHFPFPVSQRSAEETNSSGQSSGGQRSRHSSSKGAGKRMHTARARDGGRTQSGGVKGIVTDD